LFLIVYRYENEHRDLRRVMGVGEFLNLIFKIFTIKFKSRLVTT